MERAVEKIKALGSQRVRFIILYGSASEDRMRASSDIDICVYYDDEVDRASEFRLWVLSNLFDDIYDIKIFQKMPVYARIDVFKGKVLYCDDLRFLYDKAYETIKSSMPSSPNTTITSEQNPSDEARWKMRQDEIEEAQSYSH